MCRSYLLGAAGVNRVEADSHDEFELQHFYRVRVFRQRP